MINGHFIRSALVKLKTSPASSRSLPIPTLFQSNRLTQALAQTQKTALTWPPDSYSTTDLVTMSYILRTFTPLRAAGRALPSRSVAGFHSASTRRAMSEEHIRTSSPLFSTTWNPCHLCCRWSRTRPVAHGKLPISSRDDVHCSNC